MIFAARALACAIGVFIIVSMLADPDTKKIRDSLPLRLKILLTVVGLIVAIFALLHHLGGGLGSHGH